MSDLSVMGLAEVLPHLPRLIRRLNQTTEAALTLKPDAVVTVDSPGFCLRLAHHLRGSGIPVIHYVAPQLWAWRPVRARKLAKRIDHIMALLPFEVPFFAKYGITRTFVGHPAIEPASSAATVPPSGRGIGFPPDATLLSRAARQQGRRECAAHAAGVRRGAAQARRRNTRTCASSFRWSTRWPDLVSLITRDGRSRS